jgi:hypothetical protein
VVEGLFYNNIRFSGILFGYLVLSVNLVNNGSSQSLFGFFTISALVYPWILLLLMQLIMPSKKLK